MNFAEALRQAAVNRSLDTGVPAVANLSEAQISEIVDAEAKAVRQSPVEPLPSPAVDAVTAQPISAPEPPVVATGSVVRLELFLSPEQMTNLFRAVSATQHSMMTLREAATYLRVHANVLEQMAQDGEIPAFNIDGRWRFPKNGIDDWLSMQAFRKESA